jgi:hypothetical protein
MGPFDNPIGREHAMHRYLEGNPSGRTVLVPSVFPEFRDPSNFRFDWYFSLS